MTKEIQLQEIKCSNCAGEVVFDPGTQLSVCNFCGSSFDIKQAKSIKVIEPDGIIPFKVSKDVFNNSVLAWLSEGDFTPDDILSGSSFEKLSGIYLPFFFFAGQYNANWSASCGYNREETYLKKNSDGKLTNATRTVTDWRPASATVSDNFSELGIASALLPSDYAFFCEDAAWESGAVKDFDSQYTKGFVMEPFSISSENSFNNRVKEKINKLIDGHVNRSIPGDTKKDVQWTASIQKKATNIYLPFWLATYSYKDKKYSSLVDGQKSDRVTGIRPVDEDRVKTVKSYFLPLYLTLALYGVVVAIFLYNYGFSESTGSVFLYGLIPIAITGIIGWHRKYKLIKTSKQIRQEILQKFKT